MKIEFSLFNDRLGAKNGVRHWLTIDDIVELYFKNHIVKDKDPNGDIKEEKDGLNFTITQYINPEGPVHRKGENIIGAYGLCIDVDNKDDKVNDPYITKAYIQEALSGFRYILHTTHTHMMRVEERSRIYEPRPKYRAILFFDKVINVADYKRVCAHFRSLFPCNDYVDTASDTLAQGWYLPSCRQEMLEYAEIINQPGNLIDTEKILDSFDGAVAERAFKAEGLDTQRLMRNTNSATYNTIYNSNKDFVNPLDENNINQDLNVKSLFRNNTIFNQQDPVFQRVLNVLSEPLMHVSNFTGAGYKDWITIGSAIKGCGFPFEIFDQWSAQDASKYEGSVKLYERWCGFNGTAREGSIFEIAKKVGVRHYLGYKASPHKQLDGTIKSVVLYDYTYGSVLPEGYVSYEDSLELEPAPPENTMKYFPDHLCDNAPDPIAMWIDYVLESSYKPNKTMAMASGVGALASLYHHRAIAERQDCASNIYSLGLAGSGQGKGHGIKCVKELYTQLNLKRHIVDRMPGSGLGVNNLLLKRESSLLFLFPEFEKDFLSQVSNRNASSALMDIEGTFTRIYSQTNEFIDSVGATKGDEEDAPLIPYPHVSMYATCIPSYFYKYYATNMGSNGFLARMIPFVYNLQDIKSRERTNRHFTEIPSEFLRLCRGIVDMPRGDRGDAFSTAFRPKIIRFESDKLNKYVTDIETDLNSQANKESREGNEIVSSIYYRIPENALKIALAAHEGEFITRRVYDWALEVASACAETVIVNAVRNVPQSAYDNNLQKLYQVIRSFQRWCTMEEIAGKSRFLEGGTKQRKALLEELKDSGAITCRMVQTKGRPAVEYLAAKKF